MQSEWHQTRAGRQHVEAKLFGNLITNGDAPSPGIDSPPVAMTSFSQPTVMPFSSSVKPVSSFATLSTSLRNLKGYIALLALIHQHVDNLLRGVIAEELS